MEDKTITELLKEAIIKGSKQFSDKESKLSQSYKKFSKIGIVTKSTYSLPMKDTIGKTFHEQLRFKSL